jgi:tRNA dimethylallyltransferase
VGGGQDRPGLSETKSQPQSDPGARKGRRPIVVVAGPTASGKSALALAIAERFSGFVVNADSMQVYRELAILTARPGPAALAAVPHRLYGVLPAVERCSVGLWREMALGAIAAEPERLPVVTGGSGLYLRALSAGLAPVPEIPADVLTQGQHKLRSLGPQGFHRELARLDPVMAARLAPGDSQRLLRAWCVQQATGRSLAAWQDESDSTGLGPTLVIVLMPPRAELYAACDARFSAMLAAGALAEVEALLALDLDPGLPAMKAVGVRELGEVLAGRIALAKAVAAAQQETRRYAKRQVTWIRHQMSQAHVVDAQFSERILPQIFAIIRQFLLTVSK